MKQSTTNVSTLATTLKKSLFCSQLFIISFALPSLFYVGISYNSDSSPNKHVMLTNKGKKFLATGKESANEKSIKYSAACMQL